MQYLSEFFTIILINFLAVISPGPDFALIARNSLKYSQKTAVYTAIGLGLGILVHITNSLVGVGLIISSSGEFFTFVKFAGAIYLIYLGYKSLTDKLHQQGNKAFVKHTDLPKTTAIRMGFITNVTNPKALMFFLTLFTVVIHHSTPLLIKALYGIGMSIMVFSWFAILGTIISQKAIKQRMGTFQLAAERIMGVILIVLGIKIALFH